MIGLQVFLKQKQKHLHVNRSRLLCTWIFLTSLTA